MKCNSCGYWLLKRKTVYGDGSEIVNFESPEGKGHCKILDVDTTPDFGCLSFKEGDQIEISYKDGAPWQHWQHGVCPECKGRGSQPYPNERHCGRCIGTGRVRYYDDGFIGEEKYKRHPKEKEKPKVPEPVILNVENPVGGVL